MTEREHTGRKIVDCQIIGPAAAGSAGYVASPMHHDIVFTDTAVSAEEAYSEVEATAYIISVVKYKPSTCNLMSTYMSFIYL